ncbi:hypothetical protein JOF53_002880 [Crossiella equi]|uniref:Uncharacterized protein n=1 Tax=Crossiella equi TaxID=130796 RepID=A0ABS5ABN4_9PSEU|nr:hypothetical protein [Crossiella equi]MBP2474008.1 hypothetical protein [Crossiella equi]
MQIQAINKRARERYGEFVGALDFAFVTLEELKKLIHKMDEREAPAGAWRITPPEELKRQYLRVLEHLSSLRNTGMAYESELVSREWRV